MISAVLPDDLRQVREGEPLTAGVYQDGAMIGVPEQVLRETISIRTKPARCHLGW